MHYALFSYAEFSGQALLLFTLSVFSAHYTLLFERSHTSMTARIAQ